MYPFHNLIFLILLFTTQTQLSTGSNILFYFGVSTYSHRISVWPLVEKLAQTGHSITFVQPFKPKQPNLNVTEFYPEELALKVRNSWKQLNLLNTRLQGGRARIAEITKNVPQRSVFQCQLFLDHPETQHWIKRSKFDLVVIDGLFNECGYALAHKFRAKTIFFETSHLAAWVYEVTGLVMETSWISEFYNGYPFPMSFVERLTTTLNALHRYFSRILYYYPELDRVFQNTFQDPHFPPTLDLVRETDLIFTNTHFSEELARPFPPQIISIGGMYCGDTTQKLPKDLQEFIDKSGNNGFIYVSFGSAADISKSPPVFQKIFYNVMRDSKHHFVWKYDGQRPNELSPNVYTSSWLPQQAILGHPKIKAFVTHGGLLGIHEAVWYGVPMIAMPIFAEQDFNSLRVHTTERGIMLDLQTLDYHQFLQAIQNVTTDPKYKFNIQRASKLFRDRPQSPVNTALWWTEYVLRNDHASLKALKPLGIHQTWYERRLLDVWGLILLSLILVLCLLTYIVFKILARCCCKLKKSQGGANVQKPANSRKKVQ